MKKTLAMLLALSLSCLMLVSCGDTESSSKEDSGNSSAAGSADGDDSEAEDSSENEGSSEEKNDSSEAEPETGDSKEADDSSESSETPDDGNGSLYEQLVDSIKESGSLTYSMSYEGIESYAAIDPEHIYMSSSEDAPQLVTADGFYVLNDEKKIYLKSELDIPFENYYTTYLDSLVNMTGSEFISSESETIEGAEYTVETYGVSYESSTTLKFAFNDKGELCYSCVDAGNGSAVYIPTTMTAAADASKFDISGYAEVDETEFLQWETDF